MLKGKVAIVTGGSRGIGRECCLAMAREGCTIVVAAKSVVEKKNLPGTIYSVAEECRKLGATASMGIRVDLRNIDDIKNCVKQTVDKFGRIDILINNASALWWHTIEDTPVKRYDLINSINARGTFFMSQAVLPYMKRQGYGRIVNMSPPIHLDRMDGYTAYNMSKFGMTMVALGVAQEYEGQNITANSLWPATVIESRASINFKLGSTDLWRKATILADAVMEIIKAGEDVTGQMLIDDTFLKSRGYTDADLVKYRYNPDVEPPRLLDYTQNIVTKGAVFQRGDVTKVTADERKDDVTIKSNL